MNYFFYCKINEEQMRTRLKFIINEKLITKIITKNIYLIISISIIFIILGTMLQLYLDVKIIIKKKKFTNQRL